MRFLLACAASLALAACASGISASRAADPARDGPTVILEAGLGDGAASWRSLRAALPDNLPVFTWSRAGYRGGAVGTLIGGGPLWPSDGDGRRTGAEIAGHLRSKLAEAGVPPPYVLVGHSIGANYVLSFAKAYPGEVAGLVLVDPRLPGFTRSCKAEGLRPCEIPPLLAALLSPAERAEIRGLDQTEADLADLSAIRDIPLTILTAERGSPTKDPRMRALWQAQAVRFAERFTHARHIVVAGSGHYIHRAEPQRVAAEILSMVRAIR
ncbi:alpha/beta hydrolase [Sandaracinobacter sp. RS1-74]|uniref:alpha/beta fold hydrolase n=1 Tax=Sandaracinobacteroides sayramensis TaxID=2913411 RepID=UPI001EDBA451|nr:alpha/beta hydrolase [Sandaracinobacteroides sayramensis]MCG2841201.1 alpha/beta hydrolase [Sandaracinobacteroides sayramensis]